MKKPSVSVLNIVHVLVVFLNLIHQTFLKSQVPVEDESRSWSSQALVSSGCDNITIFERGRDDTRSYQPAVVSDVRHQVGTVL